LLSRLGSGAFDIALSVSLVFEYEDALLRHAPASYLNERDIRDLVDYLCDIAIRQEIFYLWRPFLEDPGDDMVLELAVAAGCGTIVTHNVRDFRGADKLGVQILTPGKFLQDLRGEKWVH
jgi:predicted nucleic acid-binding protein